MSAKLSEAQRRTLQEVGQSQNGMRMVDDYRPAMKLLALGLIACSEGSFGASTYHITPDGRAALQREEKRS